MTNTFIRFAALFLVIGSLSAHAASNPPSFKCASKKPITYALGADVHEWNVSAVLRGQKDLKERNRVIRDLDLNFVGVTQGYGGAKSYLKNAQYSAFPNALREHLGNEDQVMAAYTNDFYYLVLLKPNAKAKANKKGLYPTTAKIVLTPVRDATTIESIQENAFTIDCQVNRKK